LAIKELPPKIAQAALGSEETKAHQELPVWKYERWLTLRAEIDRAVRSEEELDVLRRDENLFLKKIWGIAREPSTAIVANETR
jgi:hypothetical protein